MPSLTINGHSVSVDDSFDKLSPEDQNVTVAHIAQQLHDEEKPSGVGAGFANGVSGLASDVASTLGLGGIKSEALDSVAANTAPKDYKAAQLIREGGHWYNPSDYSPSAIPQILAEQSPGLASDVAAGTVGAKIGGRIAGPRGAAIGGGIGGLGSMLLRTFGPGAHENAKARTGDENAEPNSSDIVREAVKQAVAAPLNVIGINRMVPGLTGRVVGVGASGTGEALKKYLTTVGTEATAGGARDAISQVGSTIGTDKGVQYDPNKTAEAAVASGAGSGLLVAPRLAADTASATKFRKFGGDNAEAATALANRQLEASDGKKLIGPLGGTKTAAEAVASAHKDVHTELSDAAKGEDLSTDNNNTLKRIQSGGKATNAELSELATEASPETVHLARQALLSSRLKDMGEFTDNKFTGGVSGIMEDKLRALYNPTAAIASMGAAAVGLPAMIGLSPHIVAGTYGAYAAARALDKLTGARSPAQGFTDKFANANVPVRTPAAVPALPAPVSTSVPQVAPPQDTAVWGTPAPPQPSLRATLNTNAKLQTGMAQIVAKLQASKQKDTVAQAMPAIRALAATQQKPVSADVPAPTPVVASPAVKQMLQQGLPPEPTPTDSPASPAIGALMGQLRAKQAAMAPVAQATPAATPTTASAVPESVPATAQPLAPEMPQTPLIAKITKKMAEGPVKETPHPEEDQPYAPKEDLWRKGLSDQEVSDKALSQYEPAQRVKYSKTIIENRAGHRSALEAIAHENEHDGAAVEALYHDLDHVSSQSEASKSINHFTNFMTPKAAKAVRDHYTHKMIAKRWKH